MSLLDAVGRTKRSAGCGSEKSGVGSSGIKMTVIQALVQARHLVVVVIKNTVATAVEKQQQKLAKRTGLTEVVAVLVDEK